LGGIPSIERDTSQGLPTESTPWKLVGWGTGSPLVPWEDGFRQSIEEEPILLHFGEEAAEAVRGNGNHLHFRKWGSVFRLEREVDPFGNTILYQWDWLPGTSIALLREIRWGYHVLKISYESSPFPTVFWDSGVRVTLGHRGTSIRLETQMGASVWSVDFIYGPHGRISQILKTEAPTWSFEYDVSWSGDQRIVDLDTSLSSPAVAWVDIHGDGFPDLLNTGVSPWLVRPNHGGYVLGPWEVLENTPGFPLSASTRFSDVNRDGISDLLLLGDPIRVFHGDHKNPFAVISVLPGMAWDGSVGSVDVNLDYRADFLHFASGTLWKSTADFGVGSPAVGEPMVPPTDWVDMDGDGLLDPIWLQGGVLRTRLQMGNGFFGPEQSIVVADAGDVVLVGNVDDTPEPEILHLGGDGVDIYDLGGAWIYSASGSSWLPEAGDQVFLSDMDGDGHHEVVKAGSSWSALSLRKPSYGKMVEFSDGAGYRATMTYSPIRASGWDVSPPVGMPVLSSMKEENLGHEVHRQYVYTHGRWDTAHGEFAGFERVTEVVEDRISNLVFDVGDAEWALHGKMRSTSLGDLVSDEMVWETESRGNGVVGVVLRSQSHTEDGHTRTTKFPSYDDWGNLLRMEEGEDRVTVQEWEEPTWNSPKSLLHERHLGSSVERWSYGEHGELLSQDRRFSEENRWIRDSEFSYDNRGLVTRSVQAGVETTFTYDPLGVVVVAEEHRAEDVAPLRWEVTWDWTLLRPREIRDPNGIRTQMSWDAQGRVVEVSRNGSSRMKFFYSQDDECSSVKILSPRNSVEETYGYGGMLIQRAHSADGLHIISVRRELGIGDEIVLESWPFEVQDPLSRCSLAGAGPGIHTIFDAASRPLESLDDLGRKTRWTYGPGWTQRQTGWEIDLGLPGRVEETDDLGRVWKISLQGDEFTYVFDEQDRVFQIEDPEGHVRDYVYDSLGRPVEISSEDHGVITTTFDDLSRPISMSRSNGSVSVVEYDGFSRETMRWGKNSSGEEFVFSRTYTDAGRPSEDRFPGGRATYRYDELGRLAEKAVDVGGEHIAFGYRYTDLDQVQQWILPFQRTLNFVWNDRGMLEEIPGFLSNIQYDAAGQWVYASLWDGSTVTRTMDPAGRMVATSWAGESSWNLAQSWDAQSLLAETRTPEHTQRMTYDHRSRITSWTLDGDLRDEWSWSPDGSQEGSPRRMVGDYDEAGQLREMGGATLEWDPWGRILRAVRGDAVETHIYDFDGHPIATLGTEPGRLLHRRIWVEPIEIWDQTWRVQLEGPVRILTEITP